MPRKHNCTEAPAVGEAFIAPWDETILIMAQPYIGCEGCVGNANSGFCRCDMLPLCSSQVREDGIDVRYAQVEEA